MWEGSRSGCGSGSSSRSASCSRTRCGPSPASSGFRRIWWAATRSRGRGWRCGCSDRWRRRAFSPCGEADAIFEEELLASGYYDRVWQAFAVLLPAPHRRRHGRRADLRARRRAPGGGEPGRHDGGLGRAPGRAAGADLEPDHRRGARREPGRARHHLEAAGGRSSGSDEGRERRPKPVRAPAQPTPSTRCSTA